MISYPSIYRSQLVDLWGILQCASNYPISSNLIDKANGITVSMNNYNTAYSMMQDYCLQRKTECTVLLMYAVQPFQ